MLLAELEVYHSRPIAPTRRVALGKRHLPVEPAPGPGGLLLGAIVATFLPLVDEDFHQDYLTLLGQLERGERVPQPRLRNRLQQDLVGLTRSRHRLVRADDGTPRFQLQRDKATPAQHVLGAAYAAGEVPYLARRPLMEHLRRAARYKGPIDRRFVAYLSGDATSVLEGVVGDDPLSWALELLGFPGPPERVPERAEVQRRFREMLRGAHPDTAGIDNGAAQRIAELSEARRILLAG